MTGLKCRCRIRARPAKIAGHRSKDEIVVAGIRRTLSIFACAAVGLSDALLGSPNMAMAADGSGSARWTSTLDDELVENSLKIRRAFGFNSNANEVRERVSNGDVSELGIEQFGIVASDEEVAEIARREARVTRFKSFAESASGVKGYGGHIVENGGESFTVLTTEEEAVNQDLYRSLAPEPDRLNFSTVKYSEQELLASKAKLATLLSSPLDRGWSTALESTLVITRSLSCRLSLTSRASKPSCPPACVTQSNLSLAEGIPTTYVAVAVSVIAPSEQESASMSLDHQATVRVGSQCGRVPMRWS